MLAPLVVEEDPGVLLWEILFVDHVLVEAWVAQEFNGASFGESLGPHEHPLWTPSVRIPLNHEFFQYTFRIRFLGSLGRFIFSSKYVINCLVLVALLGFKHLADPRWKNHWLYMIRNIPLDLQLRKLFFLWLLREKI